MMSQHTPKPFVCDPDNALLLISQNSAEHSSSNLGANNSRIAIRNNNNLPLTDFIITGYAVNGLPFQLIIKLPNNETLDENMRQTKEFIAEHVMPLIASFANNLPIASHHLLGSFGLMIDEIAKRQEEKAPATRFQISLGITYEASNKQLHCAGFGIGETGLAIRRKFDGSIKQLVYPTTIYDTVKKLNYSDEIAVDSKHLNQLIKKRASFFNEAVGRGDELVAHTSYPKELLTASKGGITHSTVQVGQGFSERYETVTQYSLDAHQLTSKDKSLIDNISEKTEEDIHLGAVSIPDTCTQEALAEQIYLRERERFVKNSSDDSKITIKEKSDKVLAGMDKMKAEATLPISELTKALVACNAAYETPNKNNLNTLKRHADKLKNKPNDTAHGVGIALMILGGVLAAMGGLCLLIGVPFIFSPFAPGAFGVSIAGGAMLGTGVALIATGATLFGKSTARKGVSKDIIDVSTQLKKLETSKPSL